MIGNNRIVRKSIFLVVILLAAFFSGIALAEEDSGSTHNDVLESLTQEETVSEESPVEQIVVETDTESAQQDPKPTGST